MLTPSLQSPDDRGTRWLQAQVQQILTDGAVALAPPRCESDPSCYWGLDVETGTTLYLRLAGDPEPTALYFRRGMIMGCGSGLYSMQHNAIRLIRRTLTKMGILSA